jgi:glutamate 5-kinase
MDALSGFRRLVVKIGSALLVAPDGALRQGWLDGLAADVAAMRQARQDVVLVSSGSIALGRAALGLPAGTLPLEQAQAAAAVGQIRLARAYEAALAPHGLAAAQVLVTLEDSRDRRRYLNSRATLATLLGLGVVPIVNENDTVATDEIRFGDNDRLAAQISALVGADALILLSDIDGFYSADPRRDPAARRFDRIAAITPEIAAMAGDAGTGLSRGGMRTKLMAAETATAAGATMAIAAGALDRPLAALARGAPATWFDAKGDPAAARKHWIRSMKPAGALTVDAGATAALARGKSLLPAGVTDVAGAFGRGDPVTIAGPAGPLGQGLIRYTAAEARAIAGRQSSDIAEILGYPGRAALIHRDDMAL